MRERCVLAAATCMGVLAGAGGASADAYRVSRADLAPAGGGSVPIASTDERRLRARRQRRTIARSVPSRSRPMRSASRACSPIRRRFPSCSVSQGEGSAGPGKGMCRGARRRGPDPRRCRLRGRHHDGREPALQPAAAPLQHRQGHSPARRHRHRRSRPASSRARSAARCRSTPPSPVVRARRRSTVWPSTELSFTLPKLLLQPLAGLGGRAPARGRLAAHGATATTRIKGRLRTVGYFSSIGCRGSTRLIRAAFIDESGNRAEATRTVAC